MSRGVHGEKIVAAIDGEKTPECDKDRLRSALVKYDEWVMSLNHYQAETLSDFVVGMVSLLNEYKLYIDVDLIFDSHEDFLYRQKGQLKLDNTVIEEFMPIFVRRCMEKKFGSCKLDVGSQVSTYSSVYFASSLSSPGIGGEINIKTKDQDFSMSRTLYLKSSYSEDFEPDKTAMLTTHIGYVMAELKTNLDKTMFQEAAATAHDVKQAVTGAKYYLLCDFLDMTPISTSTTDIDEILIVRKAKRISSNLRKTYSTYAGRTEARDAYVAFLREHPYSADVLMRFVDHIISQIQEEDIVEDSVLDAGYF